MAQRNFAYVIIVLALSVTPFPTHADSWSKSANKQHPPVDPENRIVKWCHVDGNKIRWASANLDIKDHVPCGQLNTVMTCDAAGNKFIGKAPQGENPGGYAYRDCSVGPRIHIETDYDKTIDYYEPTLTSFSATPEEKTELDAYMNHLDTLLEGKRPRKADGPKKHPKNAIDAMNGTSGNQDLDQLLEKLGGEKVNGIDLNGALKQLQDILGGNQDQLKQLDDLLQ